MAKEKKRPKWVIENEEKIYKLASLHCSEDEIEWIIGKPFAEIYRWCGSRIEEGRAQLKASLRRDQIANSRQGNASMQKWLGQVYLGQQETIETKHVLEVQDWTTRGKTDEA